MIQIAAVDAVGSPLFLVHLLAVLECAVVLVYARRRREYRAARWFAVWLAANGIWIGLHTVGLATFDSTARLVVDSLELAAVPVAATCWLFFTLIYSGRWESVQLRPAAVVGVPTALLTLLVVTNPIHQRVHSVATVTANYGVATVADGHTSALVWILLCFVYALYVVGMLLLVELLVQDQLFRDQAVALFVAVLVPIGASATVMTGGTDIDVTPLSFGFSATLLGYAVFRSELLQLVPASYRVGERTAMETVDQGVVVQDPNGRVVLTNAAAESILDVDSHRIVGSRFEDVLGASALQPRRGLQSPGVASSEQTVSDGGLVASEEIESRTFHDAGSGRTYEVDESTIEDDGGPVLGQTLFFRDVTDERRRKERLLVLNRIVRHNLRNDMNVLRGHVELIREEVDDESAAVVDDIASDLVRLGEKAHQMDRIIRDSSVGDTPVNAAGVVDRVVSRQRADSSVPIDVRGAVQAWTDTSAPVLQAVVSNLVENAVERNDGATDETVVVDVAAVGDEVTIAVSDRGPPIPEQEIATLLEGEISTLQHSSGIGLWTVRWCIDIAGADLEIDTGDETTISVTFSGEAELQTAATGAP